MKRIQMIADRVFDWSGLWIPCLLGVLAILGIVL